MEQATFVELEHDSKKRRTRRELFLEKMDGLVPWAALEALVEPFHPKPGRGRRPYPLRTMLRVHCVQLWYDLSDPGMEDLLYEVESVRRFAGLRLSGPLPDETTILKFRHLLERHGLGGGLFEAINAHLADEGHSLRRGTVVDASIVDAPTSTKNAKRERDPEMHQTKKGNQWYFGMKAHIGVDAESGLAHGLATTAANVSDVATVNAGSILPKSADRRVSTLGWMAPGPPLGKMGMIVLREVVMIHDLRRQGLGIAAIARQTGLDRKPCASVPNTGCEVEVEVAGGPDVLARPVAASSLRRCETSRCGGLSTP